MRDVKRIWANLILVVFPFKNRDQQSSALRNWDLWGPMVRSVSRQGCCMSRVVLPNGTGRVHQRAVRCRVRLASEPMSLCAQADSGVLKLAVLLLALLHREVCKGPQSLVLLAAQHIV